MRRNLDRVLGLLLLIATIGVYWQVQHQEFIYFDDPSYVTDNQYVKRGLTRDGLAWAFSTFHGSNWHPLTWLSHMLDCELYGLNPAGHHLTNLFFHVANTLLLFLVFRESTGRLWRSFLVAALFALHPLHVESVAWVSERKDVLSTFFWMLTMLVYVRYTRHSRMSVYLLALSLFACGLLAKPMLVTLPFVLLLFDFWPLGRLQFARSSSEERDRKSSLVNPVPVSQLVWEKIPFLVLAGASSVVTFMAQSVGRAIQSLDALTLQLRIVNALVSYVVYLSKMLWPYSLAIFYPHPEKTLGLWPGLASALLLGFICAVVFREIPCRPYLAVGWLWFLGTLVPVIGLVQVGMQAMADRYTYIPLIGVFVAMVWAITDLVETRKLSRKLSAIFAALILCALMSSTWFQLQHWQNTLTLFHHALTATENNYAAHFIIARAEGERGNMDKALFHYNKAVEINPAYVAMMHNRIGYYLAEEEQPEEAISQFKEALKVRPDYANAHNNLGVMLARKGQMEEAIARFSEALKILPAYTEARKNLENAKRQKRLMQAAKSGGL
jgi:tetratricopeptide (TPR) repeat protein